MSRHFQQLIAIASLLALACVTTGCKGPAAGEPAATSLELSATTQQCGKDTDCKGERVCDGGQCDGPGTVALLPEPEESPDPYACAPNERQLFHCLTTNNKEVTLCDAGSTLRYTFGKLGLDDPELVLSVARNAASTSQGIAGQTIDLPRANTTYSVFWGFDRMSDAHEVGAGVHVQVNGRHVATVTCKEESVQSDMEDVDLKPAG